MPNGLPGALRSGFEIGRAAGGRGGIGLALKSIADRLRQTRETEEEIGVLGRTERVKAKIKQEFEPTTQPIVSETGEVIGTRPKGAVFAPVGTAEKLRVAALPPVERAPGFKYGTGGAISRLKSFVSPERAEISADTQKVISNIKNQEDLDELLNNEDAYRAAGVDVEAVKEYFGVK